MKTDYQKNTAAYLMTDKVPIAFLDDNISQVEKSLRSKKEALESINYIYVIDKAEKLIGAVSIKEIFRQEGSIKLKDLISGSLISVKASDKAEKVANLAIQHNIKSIPVLDNKGKMLGVVLSDTILDIVDREIREDLAQFVGMEIDHQQIKPSLFKSLKNRFPWLVVGMLGGFLMSKTIAFFEGTISENIILAAFIPLIVYMASAVQAQIGLFIVRDLAFNPKLNFLKYGFQQFKIVFLIGLGISALALLSSFLFYADILVSVVLAIAMFFGIISSIITGILVPFLFHKLKFDPASASGPIATIFQDLISIVIYLLVAKAFI